MINKTTTLKICMIFVICIVLNTIISSAYDYPIVGIIEDDGSTIYYDKEGIIEGPLPKDAEIYTITREYINELPITDKEGYITQEEVIPILSAKKPPTTVTNYQDDGTPLHFETATGHQLGMIETEVAQPIISVPEILNNKEDNSTTIILIISSIIIIILLIWYFKKNGNNKQE
ncbi:hypothetical protein KY330_00645 [Candidatus Woesearchaeota archaeon]|nr:hypothetical protein [Candidatus Woesearchaeota archaeon]